jgi:hypothetical protein
MTTTSAQATVTAQSAGQALYDSIMRGIDPELCSDAIPHLAEKYKDESKEDRAKRAERYNKAFAVFDAAAADQIRSLKNTKSANKKQALKSAEAKSRTEESAHLQKIELLFS